MEMSQLHPSDIREDDELKAQGDADMSKTAETSERRRQGSASLKLTSKKGVRRTLTAHSRKKSCELTGR